MTERPACLDVLSSSASRARFLVIETGIADGMPSINGGVMMSRGKPQACSTAKGLEADGDLRGGERYVDVVTGLTLLCVRPGRGPLCYDGRRLSLESNRGVRLSVAAAGVRGT